MVNLNIFVMKGCHYCTKVKEDNVNKIFEKKLGRMFEKIEMHEYDGTPNPLFEKNDVHSFPTFIVNDETKEIGRHEGYDNVDDLMSNIKKMLQSNTQTGGNIDFRDKYYQYKKKYLLLKKKLNKQ